MNNEIKHLVKSLRDSAKQARAIDRSEILHKAADTIEYLAAKCDMLSMIIDKDDQNDLERN